MLAGIYDKEGYEVTLTPSSGDHGRDIIAVKRGRGCVRILGSMKRYAPHVKVTRAHVHEMFGVVASDPAATKGVIATTSDFAPELLNDQRLKEAVPYRLELYNGTALQEWLKTLSTT